MNYSDLIRRTAQENNTGKCRHGLDTNFCCYCNGMKVIKRVVVKESKVSEELWTKYETSKGHFKNYRDLWTEDEFFVVYANLKDVMGTKEEKRVLYQTAIELERTLGAIVWAKEHIFSKKEYHRGNIVLEFRKLFGIGV